jgi:diadenosine tetraphosphate (Ap4A) HIT family hydrolase
MPWWSDADWARMRSGADCPMCADGHLPVNEHGDLIAELPGSYARLCRNQTHAGYSVVIAKRHAVEVHDLTSEELHAFWADVAALGRTITNLFEPVKLDNLVMGHLCPHVHCHVYPQYPTSDPHALIDIQEGTVRLSDDAWNERLEAIRTDLARHYP